MEKYVTVNETAKKRRITPGQFQIYCGQEVPKGAVKRGNIKSDEYP